MIDQRIIDKVTEVADIVDVVSDFVTLKKKGARYLGLCPFHDDRHIGNFVVYPAKNVYRCFACDAKGGPIQFVKQIRNCDFPDAIRYLAKKYNIPVEGTEGIDAPTQRTPPPPLPTLFLPTEMVTRTLGRDSALHTWLRNLPWSSRQAERVEQVLDEYQVGTTKQGFTVFWQIDDCGGIRTGHCILYKPNGHRYHDDERAYNSDWTTAMLRREVVKDERGYPVRDDAGEPIPRYPQYDEEKVEMRQTLFGMHLLDKYPTADVHIVESEKTALVCAIYFGNDDRQVWMACCGKYNLTAEKLAPIIKRRRVVALHPDKDGADEWRAKLEHLGYNRAYINDAMMALRWKPEDGPKADMADVIVRLLDEGQRSSKAQRISDILPRISPAIAIALETLDLEPCNEREIRADTDQGVGLGEGAPQEH